MSLPEQPDDRVPTEGDGRFPKAARLRRPSEFQRVQKAGRTFDLGPLVARVAPRPPAESGDPLRGRLGLAVSRRAGGAVERNRIKRRVREAFRHRQRLFAALDVVVSARPAAAQAPSAEVERLFDLLLERLGRRPEER